jgi:hypothetical protein
MKEMMSWDDFYNASDLAQYVLRMHLSKIGKRGGLSRSEAKKKACRLNAQKRWAKVRAQPATPAPGGVISSNTPPPSSHVQE